MTKEKKAIKLAIHALKDYRLKHYSNSAAVFKAHYDEYTEAIDYFHSLLTDIPQQPIPADTATAALWHCDRCKAYNTLGAMTCAVCGALREVKGLKP